MIRFKYPILTVHLIKQVSNFTFIYLVEIVVVNQIIFLSPKVVPKPLTNALAGSISVHAALSELE
jgi:hypothetical protein